jgi:ribosomal protein L24
MPREKGWKDRGDRVVVKSGPFAGKHGTVLENDGFGEILVRLDDGTKVRGYEGAEFDYENGS